MGDLVTSDRFLRSMGEEVFRLLYEAGGHLPDRADLSDLELPARAPEEAVVGRITDEEAVIFRALVEGNKAHDAASRAKIASALAAASEAARDPSADLAALQAQAEPTEEEAAAQYRLSQGNHLLHALLHWKLGERLGLHDWRLGVRRGGVIVTVERRW